MGIYLNPGNENFREIVGKGIYVDKTMMIDVVNHIMDHDNKYICISRPRRFGKTIAGNMLSAYYSKGCDSRKLFAPYKISKTPGFEEKLNRFNVIKIDMNSEYQNAVDKDDFLQELVREIILECRAVWPDIPFLEKDSLARCLLRVYAATGETFVILIDEYDVLVREQVPKTLFDQYLSFLNGLFKSDTLRPAISLAYLTGILPVVRDKIQSKLNNFREYTFLDAGPLAPFAGFTVQEVQELCEKYGMSFEECRHWYDGYRQNGYEIYNPESVVISMDKKVYGSYWGQTSSYEAISDRIRMNFAGTKEAVIRMLAGEAVDVNVTRYLNTMTSFKTKDDLFTYLIHLGYLAYSRGYGNEGSCRIPNWEVQQEWMNAIAQEEDYAVTNRIIEESKELLARTLAGDEEAVARALDISHIHVTSNRSYNNEDALQSAIYLAYLYALNRYTIVREMTAGKGFADVVFIPVFPKDPAMIIELKKSSKKSRTETAGRDGGDRQNRRECQAGGTILPIRGSGRSGGEGAIRQIRDKEYFDSLSHYQGNLLFVGIEYDEGDKTHTCRIERFVKEGYEGTLTKAT